MNAPHRKRRLLHNRRFFGRLSAAAATAAAGILTGAAATAAAPGAIAVPMHAAAQEPPAPAALTPEQRAKVRRILPLPAMELGVQFHFTTDYGFILESERRPLEAELLAHLRQRMPEDPEERAAYLLRTGVLQHSDPARADEAFRKAEEEYEALAQSASGNPNRRGRFLALAANTRSRRHSPEASADVEVALRDAVKIAPEVWETWDCLAQHLLTRVSLPVLGKVFRTEDAVQALQENPNPPTAEQEQQAKALFAEVMRCHDQAVAAAEKVHPRSEDRDPRVYLSRAVSRMGGQILLDTIATRRDGGTPDPPAFLMEQLASASLLQDIERAAACRPDDPLGIGTLASFRFYEFVRKQQKSGASAAAFKMPPRPEDVSRLTGLLRDAKRDETTRGRAAEVLVLLYLLSEDYASVVRICEEGLKVAPERRTLYEGACLALSKEKQYAKMATIAEEFTRRASVSDRTRAHLLLARVRSHQNDLPGAERALAEAAAVSDTSSAGLVALAQATLALKRSSDDDPQQLAEAGRLLTEAAEKYGDNFTPTEYMTYVMTLGAYSALTGDLARARESFDAALAQDPEHEQARELRALLP